jgi:membrane protease YdiL (CAAX protease family)
MSSWLAPHLRGHALLFESPPPPRYRAVAGFRLLLVFALFELVLGPRLGLLDALGLATPPAAIRVPLLLGAALLAVRYGAGVPLSELGLRRWREWSVIEKSYFVQVVLAASLLVALVQRSLVPGMAIAFLWGFHQELMYRGILQTELARRWGLAGILAANAIFTFGPLHFYHALTLPAPQAALMFAAIFAIGAFFAGVFARSGNLWIVGVFHGIGNAAFGS